MSPLIRELLPPENPPQRSKEKEREQGSSKVGTEAKCEHKIGLGIEMRDRKHRETNKRKMVSKRDQVNFKIKSINKILNPQLESKIGLGDEVTHSLSDSFLIVPCRDNFFAQNESIIHSRYGFSEHGSVLFL